jgi:hypothetical protein
MSKNTHNETSDRPPVGNLTDFVYGADADNPLHIEVAIKEDGKVVVFHDKPFKKDISWFEFDLDTNKFDFIMDEGDLRDFGMPLDKSVAVHMQNSHQILMVLLDDDTGEAKEGNYVPLIIHSA